MLAHIEGGGVVDSTRKNFWRRAPKTKRMHRIEILSPREIEVDGEVFETAAWLRANEEHWLQEWRKWRAMVALCSRGDFHWGGGLPTVAFRYKGRYLDFVEWKMECYMRPSYEKLPSITVFQELKALRDSGYALGLVHPKGYKGEVEEPITEDYLRELMLSPDTMCCQPYVVAARLLGMELPVRA